MCEFVPFNPFAIYEQSPTQERQESFNQDFSQNAIEEPASIEIEDFTQNEENSSETQTTVTKFKSNSSKFHNMTKQLVITMKQIMSKTMINFGSTTSIRIIISQIWQRLVKKSHPTKQTLKAMFSPEVNTKILKKEGLIEAEDQYNSGDFQQAMDELKFELLLRLKQSSIRSNLIDRKIVKKDVLLAYIQHFLHEQLCTGDIKARFGPSGASKIEKIMNKSQGQTDFISDFLI